MPVARVIGKSGDIRLRELKDPAIRTDDRLSLHETGFRYFLKLTPSLAKCVPSSIFRERKIGEARKGGLSSRGLFKEQHSLNPPNGLLSARARPLRLSDSPESSGLRDPRKRETEREREWHTIRPRGAATCDAARARFRGSGEFSEGCSTGGLLSRCTREGTLAVDESADLARSNRDHSKIRLRKSTPRTGRADRAHPTLLPPPPENPRAFARSSRYANKPIPPPPSPRHVHTRLRARLRSFFSFLFFSSSPLPPRRRENAATGEFKNRFPFFFFSLSFFFRYRVDRSAGRKTEKCVVYTGAACRLLRRYARRAMKNRRAPLTVNHESRKGRC